jgi:hypothetical protein
VTIEHVFDTLQSMACGWKQRGRKCGAEPTVAVRDLGPSYGKLRMQPVCQLHSLKGQTARNPYARRSDPDGRRDDVG